MGLNVERGGSNFYVDKGALMNLNQCPSGIHRRTKQGRSRLGFFSPFLSQMAFQTDKGVPNFANTKMAVAIFANCHRRALCQGSGRI